MHTEFGSINIIENDHLEDRERNGWILLQLFLKIWSIRRKDVNWIELANNGVQWRPFALAALILGVKLHTTEFITFRRGYFRYCHG